MKSLKAMKILMEIKVREDLEEIEILLQKVLDHVHTVLYPQDVEDIYIFAKNAFVQNLVISRF